MPKIEIPLNDFLTLAKLSSTEGLEEKLEPLKAELDGLDDETIKIELNDTNRPDLWTAEGVARALRCYRNGSAEEHLADMGDPERYIEVSEDLKGIRPYIAAFTARGWTVDQEGLDSLIAAQEKLAASFGRDRKTAAIGFYSLEGISFPVSYRTESPATSFHPLGEESPMSLSDVLERTEAGMKYAGILQGLTRYPLLRDAAGEVLSFPPVLNSNSTGRVVPGQNALFCEVTGTDWHTVNLTATILACNLEDRGAVIEPVQIRYSDMEDTVTPVIYRDTLTAGIDEISAVLGEDAAQLPLKKLLEMMDYSGISVSGENVTAVMPPYRRDGIHPMDLIEDISIALGLNSIEPVLPSEYTVGSAAPVELLSRSVKSLLVGAGCEEILRPVLTSREKIVTLSRTPGEPIAIRNPMTAEYGVVSSTLLPALLEVESVSGHAAFPHRIFTVGEVLVRTEDGVCDTRVDLAVTVGDSDFGAVHSILGILCHFRNLQLSLRETDDPRFIPGRSAEIVIEGKKAGIIGEFHPEVLQSWGIAVPVAGFELQLERLG